MKKKTHTHKLLIISTSCIFCTHFRSSLNNQDRGPKAYKILYTGKNQLIPFWLVEINIYILNNSILFSFLKTYTPNSAVDGHIHYAIVIKDCSSVVRLEDIFKAPNWSKQLFFLDPNTKQHQITLLCWFGFLAFFELEV